MLNKYELGRTKVVQGVRFECFPAVGLVGALY